MLGGGGTFRLLTLYFWDYFIGYFRYILALPLGLVLGLLMVLQLDTLGHNFTVTVGDTLGLLS